MPIIASTSLGSLPNFSTRYDLVVHTLSVQRSAAALAFFTWGESKNGRKEKVGGGKIKEREDKYM